MADTAALPSIAEHGASRLPSVELDSYNIELKDDEGFIGDRASKGAFREIIDNWRKPLRKAGNDPFGEEPSEDISRKKRSSRLCEKPSRSNRPSWPRRGSTWNSERRHCAARWLS